jgi:rod shape-determining protein MreC
MALYRRARNTRVLVVSLVMVCLLTITIDYRGGQSGPLASAGRGAFTVVGALQEAVSRVFQPVGSFFSGLVHVGSLQSENAALKRRIAQLEQRAAQNTSRDRELERLRALYDLTLSGAYDGLVAQVIGQSLSNFEFSVTVDLGASQGVRLNDPVVSGDGLVGKVVLVTSNWSKVQLVIDRESGVAGRLSSSGATGIVLGNTDRHDLVMDLPFSTDVKVFPDEVVETSGFDEGSIYPPGILIGYVSASSAQAGSLHQTINVRPAVDFSSLEFVLVVTNSMRPSPSPSG